MNPDGIPFLSLPFNFALTLNVDWFQPFKNTTYSTGAIYISIQNLPRKERYATGNVLLVGIIPGPHEPSKTMNSYLTPLVDELNQLWDGVVMQSFSSKQVVVRAALLCTACDIPAARKVSGFVGHNALHGCSKCLKNFQQPHLGRNLIKQDIIERFGSHVLGNSIISMLKNIGSVIQLKHRKILNVFMVVGILSYWNCPIIIL